MELRNDFRVSAPPNEAWKVLTDVERIAPMLPGAKLEEIEGDEFRGLVKVKVGPITAQYKGKATFEEQDESAGRVVLKATGRDTRGQGNANATITATLVPDGDGTKVTVVTDLTITGKVAQFGRGVLADVSGKLIGQFVDALEADLRAGDTTPTDVAPVDTAQSEAEAPAASTEAAATPVDVAPNARDAPATSPAEAAAVAPGVEDAASEVGVQAKEPEAPTIRKVNSPDPEPVDLLHTAGGSVGKRIGPILGGVVALLLVVAVVRRRRK